jgi:hypothetical protein
LRHAGERRTSPAGEAPRLCRGGSRSLTVPGMCRSCRSTPAVDYLSSATDVGRLQSQPGTAGVALWVGCEQAPLRGQQPKSLRLCRRMVTSPRRSVRRGLRSAQLGSQVGGLMAL